MKPKTLLLTITALLTLNSCCWTDHSETIKEVAEPMLKELDAFYKKEKRFPTTKERNMMLEKVGCTKVEGNVCGYKNRNIVINEWRADNYYSIRMTYQNTYCSLYLNSDGSIDRLSCKQNPCIDIGQ
jgi:hypothetical protein